MFEINDAELLIRQMPERKSRINNSDKVEVKDTLYLEFVLGHNEFEITPDIQLLSYEQVLNENRYIKNNYPEIAEQIWIFARSGQGDEWFLNKESLTAFFYDHNKGEYTSMSEFVSLSVTFSKFIQIAFLYKELEDVLDEGGDIGAIQANFESAVNEIDKAFYNLYPYKYF